MTRNIAEEIIGARRRDRHQDDRWFDFRTGARYLLETRGLSAPLDYIRYNLNSRIVVDIGAGTTNAVYELSQAPYFDDFEIIATVLTRPNLSRIENHWKNRLNTYDDSKIVSTSAEKMRGFSENSIALVLAIHSISYSSDPGTALFRINEILEPGGIIKAVFRHPELDGYGPPFEKTHDDFSDTLHAMGYELAIEYVGHNLFALPFGVLITAMKPSGDEDADFNNMQMIISSNTSEEDTIELTRRLRSLG